MGQSGISTYQIIAFICLHLLLVVAMKRSATLATLHAYATLGVSLALVLGSRRIATAGVVAAYIAGAEGLWRMTNASVFWEYGKYAMALVLLVAVWRHRQSNRGWLPLVYFALLLPSAALTVANLGPASARGLLSFNLAGPFALAIACFYFQQVRQTWGDLQATLTALLAPIVAMAGGCLFGILSVEEIQFTTESNFDTSGGYGPNQVSSTLGLGMFAAFLGYYLGQGSKVERVLYLGALLFLASMSALTFSRSGLYIGAASSMAAVVFLARNRRGIASLLLGGAAILCIAGLVVFPRLNEFTGGKLSERFQEKNLSHRGDLAQTDLQIGLRNPLAGVGVGMVKRERMRTFGMPGMAHTEFTRLVAEHGILGLLALAVLVVIGRKNFLQAAGPLPKGVVAGFLTFSVLFMLVAAMRLVSPAFAFGLTCARLLPARANRTRISRPAGGLRLRSQYPKSLTWATRCGVKPARPRPAGSPQTWRGRQPAHG